MVISEVILFRTHTAIQSSISATKVMATALASASNPVETDAMRPPEWANDLEAGPAARDEVRLRVGRGVEDVRVDSQRSDIEVGREIP